jgi:hypothetical protein
MSNLFVIEQLIIDRLKAQVVEAVVDEHEVTTTVQLFKTIGNPSLIAGLSDIGPLLPACFVMPGAAEIASQQTNGAGVVEEQEWHIVIVIAHQAFKAQTGLTESVAGTLMHACIVALSGWLPESNNFIRPMLYAGRAEPDYNLGYAEFPLSFKIKKMVVG